MGICRTHKSVVYPRFFFWGGGGFWWLIPIIYQTIDLFHNGDQIQLSFVSILMSLSKHAAMGSKVMQVGLINLNIKGITNRPPFMKLVQWYWNLFEILTFASKLPWHIIFFFCLQNPPSFTVSDPKPVLARSSSFERPRRRAVPAEDLKRQSLMEPLTVPTTDPLLQSTPQVRCDSSLWEHYHS